MSALDIVPIRLAGRQHLIEGLAAVLERTFQARIHLREPWFESEDSFDPSRGQFNSTILLKLLLDDPSGSTSRVLGVTSVDLFMPVLTYVFGEAQLEGRAAVVSVHRLRPENYGLPADRPLLSQRLEKEAIHELGHTFGLIHCPQPACVMHASTYVEEIDLKSAGFCTDCLGVVRGVSNAKRRDA